MTPSRSGACQASHHLPALAEQDRAGRRRSRGAVPAAGTADTGDLRKDLLACGRAYVQSDGRSAQVMASVLTASRHDSDLREAAQRALGAPYIGLFERALARALERGLIDEGLDLDLLARVLPALA